MKFILFINHEFVDLGLDFGDLHLQLVLRTLAYQFFKSVNAENICFLKLTF